MNIPHKTSHGLSPDTRSRIVELLNQRLADAIELRLQAKQAHWNVKGPHFFALHELFDKTAAELDAFTDDIAERAVQLGGIAAGTLQAVALQSTLPAWPPGAVSGARHIAVMTGALAEFGTRVRHAIDAATEAGDAGTADLFTGVSRGVDKLLWLVEAHAQSQH